MKRSSNWYLDHDSPRLNVWHLPGKPCTCKQTIKQCAIYDPKNKKLEPPKLRFGKCSFSKVFFQASKLVFKEQNLVVRTCVHWNMSYRTRAMKTRRHCQATSLPAVFSRPEQGKTAWFIAKKNCWRKRLLSKQQWNYQCWRMCRWNPPTFVFGFRSCFVINPSCFAYFKTKIQEWTTLKNINSVGSGSFPGEKIPGIWPNHQIDALTVP